MPLYELKCTGKDCEHEFEEQVKLADMDNIKCPLCGTKAVIEMRNNPLHHRHSSATRWRMGHGS